MIMKTYGWWIFSHISIYFFSKSLSNVQMADIFFVDAVQC